MSASMLSGLAGIEQVTLANSAAYVSHWVKVLKGDSRLVGTAAAQARRASDCILGIAHDIDARSRIS